MDMPAHQPSMSVLMTPDTANFSGNVHGGTILKQLDQVVYACAARYAACYVVTMSVDQVVFRQPISSSPGPVPREGPFSLWLWNGEGHDAPFVVYRSQAWLASSMRRA